MADDNRTDDEREADRLLKEAAPLRERHRILMAAIRMGRCVCNGEVPDPVAVEDATVFHDPGRPGTGVVIRDFLGREYSIEEWQRGA